MMFEITDDDDGFWEKLPLDEVEFNRTEPANASSGFSIKKDIDGPSVNHTSGSLNDEEHCSSPMVSSMLTRNVNNSSSVSERRPQLVQIHNVLTGNRTLDKNSSASTSAVRPQNELHGKRTRVGEDPLHFDCSSGDGLDLNLGSISSHKSSYKIGSKRKFPGPAGLLPKSFSGDSNSSNLLQDDSPVIVKDSTRNEVFPSSQSSSCDPFTSQPWKSLLLDIGPDAKSVLGKFAIRSMLVKASKRVLPKGKIPLVLALVESVDFHGCDGTAVLKDPSGKVHGALHYDLVKDPSTALKAGWVLVLRQTSVISPTPRNHYLNITPANIVVIYSHHKDSNQVHKSSWSPTSTPDAASTFPPLSEIIHESDQELISALNHPPFSPQQPYPSPRCPNSGARNTSQMSLFGSVAGNSSPLQSFNRFPATNTTNGPVNSRFKSPIPSHTATPPTLSPLSHHQRSIANPSKQSSTPNRSKHQSSSHHRRIDNTSIHYNKPVTINHQSPNVSHYTHLSSTSEMSGHQISNKMASQTKSVQHYGDFPDDDSDFFALCDDSEILVSSNNETFPDHNTTKVQTSNPKTDAGATSVYPNVINGQNKQFSSQTDKNVRINSNTSETNSRLQQALKINDSNQSKQIGGHFQSTAMIPEQREEPVNGISGDKDSQIPRLGTRDTRDARIELGAFQSQPQQRVPDPAQGFDIWDDDLDDELLSQL